MTEQENSIDPSLWVMQEQECEGDYFFAGNSYMTKGIAEALHPIEVAFITLEVKNYVAENNGADYLFVFIHKDGRKVYVIDQLSKSMMESGGYTTEEIKEYNLFTVLFAHEY